MWIDWNTFFNLDNLPSIFELQEESTLVHQDSNSIEGAMSFFSGVVRVGFFLDLAPVDSDGFGASLPLSLGWVSQNPPTEKHNTYHYY